jgi:hypothetical protein
MEAHRVVRPHQPREHVGIDRDVLDHLPMPLVDIGAERRERLDVSVLRKWLVCKHLQSEHGMASVVFQRGGCGCMKEGAGRLAVDER